MLVNYIKLVCGSAIALVQKCIIYRIKIILMITSNAFYHFYNAIAEIVHWFNVITIEHGKHYNCKLMLVCYNIESMHEV